MAATALAPADPYAGLAEPDAAWLREQTTTIHVAWRRTAEDTIRIGRIIIEVRARIEHGHYLTWIATALPFSPDTAHNIRWVAERFGDHMPKVSAFDVTALYLLARPSAPPEAFDLALKMADEGRKVSYTAARDIIRQTRPQPPADASPLPGRTATLDTGTGREPAADRVTEPDRPRRRSPDTRSHYVRRVKGDRWQARVWLGPVGGPFDRVNLGLYTSEWLAHRAGQEFTRAYRGGDPTPAVIELQRRGVVPPTVPMPRPSPTTIVLRTRGHAPLPPRALRQVRELARALGLVLRVRRPRGWARVADGAGI